MRSLAIGLALAVVGCAHRPAATATTPVRRIEMEPLTFEAHGDGSVAILDAEGLFERGSAAYREKDWAASAAAFDRVASDFPASRLVPPALYNAGLAFEAAHDLAAAAARYRRLVTEHPVGNDALDALYRLGAVYADAHDFHAAADTYARILERPDTTLGDRVEAMARRGVAELSEHDLLGAEHTLREALAYYKSHESEERLESDFFLGMAAFYLGEIAREQYRLLPVRLPERQLAADLESKARQLLVAQSRYIDAMKVHNPSWATAAGYQIGALYRAFYDDLVGAPVPPELRGEAREVYLEEVKKQVRGLLQRAISVHEKNVAMAERIGEKNEWVERSTRDLDELRKLLEPGALPQPVTRPTPAPPLPPLPRPRDPIKPRVIL